MRTPAVCSIHAAKQEDDSFSTEEVSWTCLLFERFTDESDVQFTVPQVVGTPPPVPCTFIMSVV